MELASDCFALLCVISEPAFLDDIGISIWSIRFIYRLEEPPFYPIILYPQLRFFPGVREGFPFSKVRCVLYVDISLF